MLTRLSLVLCVGLFSFVDTYARYACVCTCCVQVAFGCLASTLFAAGLCLAGVAVYRRIILKSKTSLL